MKKISLFLFILLATLSVSAQDSYQAKLDKLIKIEMDGMDLQQIAEKTFSNGLAGKGELSDEAQRKAKEFTSEIMPKAIDILKRHYRANLTEQQLDEIIVFMQDPESSVARKRLINLFSDGKAMSKIKDLMQPALLAAFNGKKASVSTEDIPADYRSKFNEFVKSYDFVSKMTSVIDQVFKSFVPHDATPEQLEQMKSMQNTLTQFFNDNGNDIAMVLCHEMLTANDLDRVNKLYATPTGQAYQRALNGATDEFINLVIERIKGYRIYTAE